MRPLAAGARRSAICNVSLEATKVRLNVLIGVVVAGLGIVIAGIFEIALRLSP